MILDIKDTEKGAMSTAQRRAKALPKMSTHLLSQKNMKWNPKSKIANLNHYVHSSARNCPEEAADGPDRGDYGDIR